MKPNKLIYTANEDNVFKVYTGEFGSKTLSTVNNDSIMSYDTIMEVMEAGSEAYNERRNIYETFENYTSGTDGNREKVTIGQHYFYEKSKICNINKNAILSKIKFGRILMISYNLVTLFLMLNVVS